MGDTRISEILNSFLPVNISSSPLTRLDLSGNQLTSIPSQLKKFDRLKYVDLNRNGIQQIPSGAFNFTAKSISLLINNNNLTTIAPDAFQGSYDINSNIWLGQNKLTRFEAKVFRPILEQILSLNENPSAHVSIPMSKLSANEFNIISMIYNYNLSIQILSIA